MCMALALSPAGGGLQDPSKELAARFEEVTRAAGAKAEHETIEVMMGRKLDVPLAGTCSACLLLGCAGLLAGLTRVGVWVSSLNSTHACLAEGWRQGV